MRVRYETLCGGRLLKVTEQVDVSGGGALKDGTEFVDGQYWWVVDDQRVADDVARAMQDRWAARRPADEDCGYFRAHREHHGSCCLIGRRRREVAPGGQGI
jgi:hypothetical protein